MSDVDRSASDSKRFTLLIHEEQDGMLCAEVEDLPGCFASGTDMDELLEAAAEAIGMYLAAPQVEAPPPSEAIPNVVPWPGSTDAEGIHYAVEKAEILLRA